MSPRKWSIELLADIVSSSSSVRQVLIGLGLVPIGNNYATVNRYIAELGLNITHFHGKGWRKGSNKAVFQAIPLDDILSNKRPCKSSSLRVKLFKSGLKVPKCESCGIVEWLGEAAPLELEHIDGNHLNNTLNNLSILCANCHAFTPTYRRRKPGSVA